MPLIAEFIVEVSNPKSRPPTAAPAATSVTYVYECVPVEVDMEFPRLSWDAPTRRL